MKPVVTMFIVRRKSNGMYLRNYKKRGYGGDAWVLEEQRASLFYRRCDATQCINALKISSEDIEVIKMIAMPEVNKLTFTFKEREYLRMVLDSSEYQAEYAKIPVTAG